MTTVLQCVKELGYAHSPLVLTVFGIYVKEHLSNAFITKTPQEENGKVIMVNCYKDSDKEPIKRLIKHFVTNPPKKHEWMELMVKTRKYEVRHHHWGWKSESYLKRI